MNNAMNEVLVDSRDIAKIIKKGHWEVMTLMRRYRIPRKLITGKDTYRREQRYFEMRRGGIIDLLVRLSDNHKELVKEHYNHLLEQYQDEHEITDNTYYII